MWFMVVHGTGHTLLVTYAYAMEVVQWSKLSFLQLPKGIRRILLMGTPALAVLALVGLAGWKWLRRPGQESEETRGTRVAALKPGVSVVSGEGGGNKSAAAAATSCSAETQLQPEWKNLRFEGHRGNLTVHPLAVAGEGGGGWVDSGPPSSHPNDTHPSDTNLIGAHWPTAAPTTHSSEAPIYNLDTRPPMRKYPTASSDLPSETLSELDSIASNEDLSLPPKSPAVYDSSTSNPSPAQGNNSLVGKPIKKVIPTSNSVTEFQSSGLQSPMPDATPQDLLSKSTPSLSKSGTRNRIKVTIQIPKDLVGRFIGKQGRNIKTLMVDSDGAHVYLNQKNLPKEAAAVPCYIQGSTSQVEQALKLIEVKFPDIEIPSQLDSVPFSPHSFTSPMYSPQTNEEAWNADLKPAVIPSSPFYAMVSYIESLERVWLVPYENGSDHLDDLHQNMSYMYCYAAVVGTDLGHVEEGDWEVVGKYCAVKVSDIHWLRGHVTRLSDDGDSYEVQLVDYGSSVIVPATALKPLRKDHCRLNIQAFPCHLANVVPKDNSEEGLVVLQTLVEGMVLEAHVSSGQTSDILDTSAVPLVELYTQFGSQTPMFVNRELVDQGVSVWKEDP